MGGGWDMGVSPALGIPVIIFLRLRLLELKRGARAQVAPGNE